MQTQATAEQGVSPDFARIRSPWTHPAFEVGQSGGFQVRIRCGAVAAIPCQGVVGPAFFFPDSSQPLAR